MQYCYWMQSIVHQPLQVEHIIQFYTVTAGMYWSLACCQNNGTVYCSQHKGKLVTEDPTDQGHCQWDTAILFVFYIANWVHCCYQLALHQLVKSCAYTKF